MKKPAKDCNIEINVDIKSSEGDNIHLENGSFIFNIDIMRPNKK